MRRGHRYKPCSARLAGYPRPRVSPSLKAAPSASIMTADRGGPFAFRARGLGLTPTVSAATRKDHTVSKSPSMSDFVDCLTPEPLMKWQREVLHRLAQQTYQRGPVRLGSGSHRRASAVRTSAGLAPATMKALDAWCSRAAPPSGSLAPSFTDKVRSTSPLLRAGKMYYYVIDDIETMPMTENQRELFLQRMFYRPTK